MTNSYQLLYNVATEQLYAPADILSKFGFNSYNTDIEVLNYRGFYPVTTFEENPYDPNLYTASPYYTISGSFATQRWSGVELSLSLAKAGGSKEAKEVANAALDQSVCNCGYSTDLLTAVASQDPLARPARFQAELDEMTAISDQLDADLAAIDAATSVDEIDSILNHPSGIMVTGRGGAGPNDMQPSYFTDLQGLPPGVGEPELEIYIPGTDTVISYDAGLPDPYKFDSAGNCYNTGDYRTTIRVAATGQVLSTVTPALGPAVPIAWTYNPVIPSLGGGGGSSSVEEF